MNGQLKASQIMFLTVSFIMGSILLITMIDGIAEQDSWFVMTTGFIVALPFVLMYIHLAKRFPGKSLIAMNDIIFGKVIGKIFSVIYLLYFFMLLTFNINDLSSFYTAYIMPETPQMELIVIIVLICAFAVKRGIAAIARVSLLTTTITVTAVVVTSLLLISDMDFSHFLPMLAKPAIKYVQATQIVAELPCLEVVALLMAVPMLKDNAKIRRYWLSGMTIAALLFVLITVRDTAVLGPASGILADNSFETVRLIDIGEFLTRIELIVALNYTASLFIKISVLYYVTVSAFSELLRIEQNSSLILPLGSIAMIFAVVKVESAVTHAVWGAQYAAVFSFPCTVFFPLLMVIVAAIRKLKTAPPEAQMLQPPKPAKQKRKPRAACAPSENSG